MSSPLSTTPEPRTSTSAEHTPSPPAPLMRPQSEEATNPEQLLALAWATCLNATAQAILNNKRRSRARVIVELRDAAAADGYEFHVAAYLAVDGVTRSEGEKILRAAHARCPVSKLLRGASTVSVHLEEYAR